MAKPDVCCFEISQTVEMKEESKTLLIVKPVATVNLFVEYSCMCFKMFKGLNVQHFKLKLRPVHTNCFMEAPY